MVRPALKLPEILSDMKSTQNPAQFPYGKRGTSVAALTSAILAPHDFVAISSPECTSCEHSEPSIDDRLEFVLYEKEDTPKSTCKWLGSLEHETHEKCPHCFNPFSQYARSKRPADSVHWHAPSVPANLGRRISERMGRLTLGPYWPASRSKCVGRVSRFKCTGQWVSILAHGLVCISIFGCSQDVRHKLTKIVQLIIRSKR